MLFGIMRSSVARSCHVILLGSNFPSSASPFRPAYPYLRNSCRQKTVCHVVVDNGSSSFSTTADLVSKYGVEKYEEEDQHYSKLKQESQHLVKQASFKVRGSKHHSKLRRRHISIVCDAIQAGLRGKKGTLYSKKNTEHYSNNPCKATQKLIADLGGVGANMGIMPDFSNPQALRGYALSHFGRARLLSDLVTQSKPDWLVNKVSNVFPSEASDNENSPNNDEHVITVASLGGGCGYDFVALASMSEFLGAPRIKATVYEYEPAWKDVLADVEGAIQDVFAPDNNSNTQNPKPHTCGFESCDITLPLDASPNQALASMVGSTQIFACSYVVAENAVALRKNNYEFFRQLFAEAADGSLFFFAETTHRLWPDFIDLARTIGSTSSSCMRIAIPHIRCGKNGHQLALLKDSVDAMTSYAHDEDDDQLQQKLYERFQTDNTAHLSRLDRGWKRDERKVRGAKE
mmetsp:Transcript_24119/g.44300  ORF Transcript_24119/g.44300 Transcript_24119/m.44300 type:complete len:460 (-) Transcript_24119:240-1619(-)